MFGYKIIATKVVTVCEQIPKSPDLYAIKVLYKPNKIMAFFGAYEFWEKHDSYPFSDIHEAKWAADLILNNGQIYFQEITVHKSGVAHIRDDRYSLKIFPSKVQGRYGNTRYDVAAFRMEAKKSITINGLYLRPSLRLRNTSLCHISHAICALIGDRDEQGTYSENYVNFDDRTITRTISTESAGE